MYLVKNDKRKRMCHVYPVNCDLIKRFLRCCVLFAPPIVVAETANKNGNPAIFTTASVIDSLFVIVEKTTAERKSSIDAATAQLSSEGAVERILDGDEGTMCDNRRSASAAPSTSAYPSKCRRPQRRERWRRGQSKAPAAPAASSLVASTQKKKKSIGGNYPKTFRCRAEASEHSSELGKGFLASRRSQRTSRCPFF